MTDIKSTIAAAVLGPVKKHWVLLLSLGILIMVLGVAGLHQPLAYTLATTIFFGALLLLSGGAGLVAAFKLEGWRGKSPAILIAIVYVLTGGLLILHPVFGALSLTLLVAAFLAVSGLAKIWMALGHRELPGWV